MTIPILLDHATRSASMPPADTIDDHDMTDCTVVMVADEFTWTDKIVDWDTLTIIDDIAGARARRSNDVNDRRLVAEASGAPTPAGVVDSDERSRGLISGAALMALIAKMGGQPFGQSWTMHDNSQVTLDADGMIAMGAAVGIYVSEVHARGVALKAEIDAAETLEAIAAIDIEAGWPS